MKRIKHLLLVDDDPTTNFFNRHLITKTGCCDVIHEAKNGQEALDILELLRGRNEFPEIILLDINMPIMNGFEFLDRYIQMEKNLRTVVVCMLTTSLADEDLLRAQKYEVLRDYIDKPLRESKINELLEKYFSDK